MTGYLPIAEYGVIGDQRSVALVGTNGSIDWYCPERFDAPSVFAAILDRARGGFFCIQPAEHATDAKQLYFPDTNVLITRFISPEGVTELHDFMTLDSHGQQLVRRVVGITGDMRLRLRLAPRFNYGRDDHNLRITPSGAFFETGDAGFALGSTEPLRAVHGDTEAVFDLAAGHSRCFVLRPGIDTKPIAIAEAEALERSTIAAWRRWVATSTYTGRWRERVNRSALTLALLTYAPTGAIVAAPTTSLPERIGGTRNWDYRYAWARDFAFSQYALSRLGFTEAARRVNNFTSSIDARQRPPGSLQPLYRIDGTDDIPEEELSHLEGYRGSRPVRIGNNASTQYQLDIYGELIDSLYLYEQLAYHGLGQLMSHDTWTQLAGHVDWLCEHWEEPDEGIWEVRNGRRHFTYSRLMCWVALDRAIRIATRRGFPADLPRWTTERDGIYSWIIERGWSHTRRAFVQYDGGDVLDASLLLMPLVHFIAPTDPRWLSTLDAISRTLVRDSLVYRYDRTESPDGIDGDEGTFSMCTFWYVECLARADRIEDAQLVFEKMHTYANHLGLYSEQIGSTGELLGNYPQAFTHLALIGAATDLDRVMERPQVSP
jgi:GH15 family glucan-1,4-alpha-glucosidase